MDTKILLQQQGNKARNQAIALLVLLYILIVLPVTPFLWIIKSDRVNIGFVAVIVVFLVIHFRWTSRSIYKFLKVARADISDLPIECRHFVLNYCESLKLNTPHIGIIEDDSLEAFTFGFKKKPVIVVSRGLLQKLSPTEVNAVIAHEMGHIFYRDFSIMVMSMIIPVLLGYGSYVAFRAGRSSNAVGVAGWIMGVILGIFYVVSKLFVLIHSRQREFEADKFAAQLIGDPNIMSSALMKITYLSSAEMGRRESELEELTGKEARALRKRISKVKAMSVLSINNNFNSAENKISLINSLNWDLRNYWAWYFELFSTHPSIGERVLNLNKMSLSLGVDPEIQLKKERQNFFPFCVEFFAWVMPWVLIFIIFMTTSIYPMAAEIAIILLFAVLIIRLRLLYPKNFSSALCSEVLANSHVSVMRSMPVLLDGTLQFEDAGNPSSRIFIEQDGYKIELEIPLLNFLARDKLALLNLSFVRIKGWYNRTPSPVVLLKEVSNEDDSIVSKLWSPAALILRVVILISFMLFAAQAFHLI